MYDQFWANVRAGVINWNKPTNGARRPPRSAASACRGNHRPSAFYAADYCAYPVTSSEADRRARAIGQGLRDPEPARRLTSATAWIAFAVLAFKPP